MPPSRLFVWVPLLLLSSCAQHRDIALLQAARQGDTQALQTLLSRGADPNQKDAGGLTALILSTRAGTVPAVETLLRHGADLPESPEHRGFGNGCRDSAGDGGIAFPAAEARHGMKWWDRPGEFGGRRGDRTPDLCIANAALSQLS